MASTHKVWEAKRTRTIATSMINRLRIPKSESEKEKCLKAGDENEVYCRDKL
jgi:hypothetical protein